MSKIDIESYKSFIGHEASWSDDDGDNIGIVIDISEDGEALVRKCIDLEGIEETEDTVLISVEELKLRTFVVMEKVDEGMSEGGIVSWETSNGTYYGDIQSVSSDGTVRGEPQGLEIEGSEERPAYVVRVWMWDEDEWMPTNVTVVAYSDALTMVEELPEPMEEEEPEDMPEMEEDGVKTMNIEQISEIVAREIAKALAGIAETEVKSDTVVEDEAAVVAEEAPAEEVAEEIAATEAEAVAAEEAPAEEKQDEAVAEVAEEIVAEEVKSDEQAVETATLTYNDLKELNELFKVL